MQDNFPQIQIIGTPEQRQQFFTWLEDRDRRLIEQAIKAYQKTSADPLSGHPEAAPAKYWASLKGKSNGGTQTAQAFTKWCKLHGEFRLDNGLYAKETARKFLFG